MTDETTHNMTLDERIVELMWKIVGHPPTTTDAALDRTVLLLRAFAAECEEDGRFVECPTCEGSGVELYDEGDAHPPAECDCSTCDGEGRIRRELAGALWAIGIARPPAQMTKAAWLAAAVDVWGAHAKEEAK